MKDPHAGAQTRGGRKLDRDSWLAFLEPFIFLGVGRDATRVNGVELTESLQTALHRWRIKGETVGFFKADEFLTFVGLHVGMFTDWCRAEGRPVWKWEEPEWEI